MNKNILIAVSALILSAGTLGAASAAPADSQVGIQNSAGMGYTSLLTEANWQQIRIPISLLGGTFPGSNLTLSATGLPDGVTLTLTGVTQQDQYAVLSIDTERTNTELAVNALADVTLKSGDTVLTTFQVPVTGAATAPDLTFLN
jgi:hypothetical protein